MIDARRQVREALLGACDTVKMSRPEGDVVLPLVCYAEETNAPPDPGVSGLYVRIGWRVACYASAFDELVDLVQRVDAVMTGLGYTRTSVTPDDQSRVGTDLYLRRMSYSALVHEPSLSLMPRT